MQGYNKGNLGPSLTVHYNCKLVASMQGYSKGSLWPYITVNYNG
jgi:uncharacterized protein involved in high-affinity Fe2+ transport